MSRWGRKYCKTSVVDSLEYAAEVTPCEMFRPQHQVREVFVDAIAHAAADAPVDVSWGAVGCLEHVDMSAGAGVFWVAQTDWGTERLALHYHSEEPRFPVTDLGYHLQEHAAMFGVPSSWTGSADNTVVFGTDDYYPVNPFANKYGQPVDAIGSP